ncbi:MAG: SpoIIE family protein phosphatase [Terriglobales bacterium]|jgi:phosphoserine phosphatase RsbU/P
MPTFKLMRGRAAFPKPFLATAAILFAMVAIAYGSIWMYGVRISRPAVELGFNKHHNPDYDERTHSQSVDDVEEGSPAERAGLRVGDRVIGINGRALDTDIASSDAYLHGRPGDAVELTVERAGAPKPLILHGVFRAVAVAEASEGLARSSALQITGSFPIPFLLVGFAVLFLRLEDPNAWLLALLFCAFVGAPGIANSTGVSPPLRTFVFTYRAVFAGMLGPLFYLFFAVFPQRSPLDRRLPWLKWAGLLFGVSMVLPGLRTGDPHLPRVVARLLGSRNADLIDAGLNYDLLALGMISLAQNSFMAVVPAEARRKSRVILWGTVAGVLPIVLERMAIDFTGYRPSFWLDTVLVLVVFLYPLSFAYAVVKHRVMDIPLLLRRSARYVLVQRGFIVLMFVVAACAITLFTHVFSRFVRADANVGMALSAVFGIVLVWTSAPLVKRGTVRIDRAFFRSAYDSRVILHDLAEKTRTVSDRRQLVTLLESHVREALHPKTFVCYLESGDGRLTAISETLPATLETLAASAPILVELASRGKTWEVLPSDFADTEELSVLAPLAPECLVPVLGRENNLIGLLVLGQRLSEEPYSGEDKRLLDSVAAQAGIALENIRLAEKMAERMETDRRTAQEMEIARQVQARLFPQKLPEMKTLDYTGACIQARTVGGDYYDFLELAPGRLGLLLADIAGKGFAGALLMANLQANLRSQYALAIDDLPRLLTSVNRLFYESTDDASYATLFFADYDDSSRKLRYANCGHLPPLLLRAPGSSQDQVSAGSRVERLHSTCTVMGLFETWHCEIAEVQLAPGDTLVLYTDGVTEAENADGQEFGESHLLNSLGSHSHLSVGPLLQAVVAAVQQFSGGSEQQDDITLVIARCLA